MAKAEEKAGKVKHKKVTQKKLRALKKIRKAAEKAAGASS